MSDIYPGDVISRARMLLDDYEAGIARMKLRLRELRDDAQQTNSALRPSTGGGGVPGGPGGVPGVIPTKPPSLTPPRVPPPPDPAQIGWLARYSSKLKEIREQQEQTFGELTRLANSAGNGLLIAGAAGAGLIGVVVKQAAAFEMTRTAFTTLLKDGGKAKQLMADLQQFSKVTPFQFTDITNATRQLLAYGFTAEQIKPMLTSLGDTVAAFGGSSDLLGRVIMAFGQMRAKQSVSGEEMRQLAEAGIPAWQILANVMGTTVPQAMKQAENKTIDFQKAFDGLLAGMGKQFGGAMAELAKTTTGRWRNLVDQLVILAINAGDKLLPAVNKLIDDFAALAGWLGTVNPQLLVWGTGIALGAGVVLKLVGAFNTVIMATRALAAMRALETIATKVNTAATNENTEAQLANAAATNGAAGAARTGMLARMAAGTVAAAEAFTGLSGALAVGVAGGAWAAGIAAAAALGIELFGIWKYSKQAREEQEKGTQLDATNLPKARGILATAKQHNQMAKDAGFKDMQDLKNQANTGNVKAQNLYQSIYGHQPVNPVATTPPAAVTPPSADVTEMQAETTALQDAAKAQHGLRVRAQADARQFGVMDVLATGNSGLQARLKAVREWKDALREQEQAGIEAQQKRDKAQADNDRDNAKTPNAALYDARKQQITAIYDAAIQEATDKLQDKKISIELDIKQSSLQAWQQRVQDAWATTLVDPRFMEGIKAGMASLGLGSMIPALAGAGQQAAVLPGLPGNSPITSNINLNVSMEDGLKGEIIDQSVSTVQAHLAKAVGKGRT